MKRCGHCGQMGDGHGWAQGVDLCHPDYGMDCYRLVTVFKHPVPCDECQGKAVLHANMKRRALEQVPVVQRLRDIG